jgi:hypothetical protein
MDFIDFMMHDDEIHYLRMKYYMVGVGYDTP